MSSVTARKTVRTYSRQAKRPLLEDEPPTKRRRVEDASPRSEPAVSMTPREESFTQGSTTRHDTSDPATSSPREASAIFSDAVQRSSLPSSPAPRSSPIPVQRRRPVFSLFKKQTKTKSTTKAPLSERSHNVQSPPKPVRLEKKRLVQMQLDLASQHRKTCKACGMEYIPSNPEDALLHQKFHAMNLGGVDFTKPVVERLRKNQVWSGGDGSFIAVVGRKDAIALRNRASDVLKVVNAELAAVPISEDDLWGRTGSTCVVEVSTKDAKKAHTESVASEQHGSPLVDRFKMYLHIQGTKCIGACLAERIWEAYAVLSQDDTSGLFSSVQSSSISISTVADPAMLGISRIWTSSQHRKQGIARKLLDTTRADFLYGMIVEKQQVAFSQPTESGGKLARKWFGRQAGWHVYID